MKFYFLRGPQFLFIFFQIISSFAHAQIFNSSVSSATGGTGRAAVEVADAALLNPSSLVHLRGDFLYSSFAEKEFAVMILDNTEESFLPAALGFVQKKTNVTQGELVQQDIAFSLAEFLRDKWSFGVTGHYLEQKLPTNSYRQTNADLGMLYTSSASMGWALVVYNIFGEKNEIPANFRMKTSVAGGFNYIFRKTVRVRLDATSDSILMAGLENYLNQFLISRIGYSVDTDDDRALFTAGLGFKGPRFVINYAYQGNPKSSGDYRHSVDLEIPF